ncbi:MULTISPECIES: NnrU family protein [Sphingomonas]|uniref:NnrU family protein n=1 Tax=Sphingomonas TaxID=13687 RepID=UPI000DEF8A8E|nr:MULTISPECIES: NnrU family protein [Sphingomonas]
MGAIFLFAVLFVGTHLVMSHPLRAPLVRRLGPRGFVAAYSAVSFATFIPLILARRSAGGVDWLWEPSDLAWGIAALLMLFASILLVGSFVKNPAIETLANPKAAIPPPHGVFRITRHPMMWSFALWAIAHLLVNPQRPAMIVALAILILALGGAAGQDAKKKALLGERWAEWEAQTSYLPFGRGLAAPGWTALLGGVALFLLATWLHPIPVGIWRWIG